MFHVQKVELANSFKIYLIGIINFIDKRYCTRIVVFAAGSENYWGFSNFHKEMLVRNKSVRCLVPCSYEESNCECYCLVYTVDG